MSAMLFIGADRREFAGLLTHWENVAPLHLPVHWARTGRWRGREAFAIANGAGVDRAFAAVLLAPRPAAVCNIGFCGALDTKLKVAEVVVVEEVRERDRSWVTRLPDGPPAQRVILLSVNRVAQTADEKRNLHEAGASIVDMEAAGAARAAEDLDVPFYSIRAVSDLAEENLATDFNAALGPDGRFSTLRLAAQLKFKELLLLQHRTALASKKLGDFIAATSF